MADILRAFDKLMELEGGGTLHTVEGDPGGMTKWGFSQRANPEVDIADLTKLDAMWLFEAKYWTPLWCGQIEHDQMAFEVVEFAFNAGFTPSIRAAQQTLNAVWGIEQDGVSYYEFDVEVDGRIGPATIASLNALAGRGAVFVLAWMGQFNLLQLRYYRNLRPSLTRRFLVGWTRRVIA